MSEGRDEKGKFIKGSKVNQGCVHSAARRERHSVAMKGRVLSDEHKEKIRVGMLAITDEGRTIGRPKGGTPWNKGMKRINGDPIPPKSPMSEDGKKRVSIASRKRWDDCSPEKKREIIKRMLKISIPNKAELFLADVLEKMYPAEWKFVGDGQVIIAGKNPDFVNVNGQKKIIELYGERWHQGDDPQERKAVFAPFGYKTLVIWSKELGDQRSLKNKIRCFCKSKTKAPVAILSMGVAA